MNFVSIKFTGEGNCKLQRHDRAVVGLGVGPQYAVTGIRVGVGVHVPGGEQKPS